MLFLAVGGDDFLVVLGLGGVGAALDPGGSPVSCVLRVWHGLTCLACLAKKRCLHVCGISSRLHAPACLTLVLRGLQKLVTSRGPAIQQDFSYYLRLDNGLALGAGTLEQKHHLQTPRACGLGHLSYLI